MYTVKNVYEAMDITAPFKNIDKGDNSGLLAGSLDDKVTRVLITLDITIEAVEEARSIGAELIVSHHPVIYYPLYNVSSFSLHTGQINPLIFGYPFTLYNIT